MGVSVGSINQISTMSELDTAMQPPVQSTFEQASRDFFGVFGWP